MFVILTPEPAVMMKTSTTTSSDMYQCRLEICQKMYATEFWGQKIYTLKWVYCDFFYSKRNSINALISVILVAFCENLTACKIFNIFSAKSHLLCKSCNSTQILREIALFSRKIYTASTNFTRPLVTTVATNLNSMSNHFENRISIAPQSPQP